MAHLHALPKEHEFEGYRIERVLGAGGFGITYLATETMIGRAVAIKEFLPSSIAGRAIDSMSVRPLVPADAEMFRWGLKRFRNEARTLVSFHHPHIVQVFRYFEANGTAYLVMAYEEGATLAEIIKTRRTLPEAELRAFLDPLLDGVAQVHKAEFLHRDIKPANIVIRRNGGPVLIDFGAARQSFGEKSQSAHAIVSAGYAPFEQYTSGGEQGPWTDIYALGATLYCCVTGTRPIEAPDRVAGAPMRSASEVAAGQYSDGFLRAIDHALALYPEERPRSIAAWRAELAAEPARPTLPTLPPQIETAVPATAPARATRRALQFGLAAAAAALVCGGGYALVSAHVAEERARAEEEGRRRAKAEEDERRRKEEAGRAEEQQKRAAAARARAEAAAGKGREAQGRAQAEGRAAVAARQQAQTAGDCARKAAGRGRSGATGYYTGQLTDGSRYEGQVNAQKYIDGCGVKTMTDKRRFEGQMSAGKVHGYVVFIGTDGRRFEGTYVSGDVNGYGVHRYPSGDELYGRFVGLNVDGAGVWIQNDGARYEGEFRASRWWGFGVIRERNGTIYEGEFLDGMRHGLGVQTTTAGEKTYGRWEKGVYKGVE